MIYVYVIRRGTEENAEWENLGAFSATDNLHLDRSTAETAHIFSGRFRQVVETALASMPPNLLFNEAVDWLTPTVLYRFTCVRPTATV
jgi:hypothetical protein